MAFSPRFRITNRITRALTKIERARGFLEAARLSEDWITRMKARALVLEAYHTTHIEGNQLTLEQSKKLLKGKKVPEADRDDARELLNYREAFEFVSGYLDSGKPIAEGIIRRIHQHLVHGVRGNEAAPGRYRKIQNYVVDSQTDKVIYTPPPVKKVPPMMSDLVVWLSKERDINPVLIAGIAQFQLVHIHPFIDGNGRTARLLSTLCLYSSGYDFKRLFSISEFYDRDRPTYYKVIQSVRERDLDLTSWLEYFVEGLAVQMSEVQERGKKIMKLDIIAQKHRLSQRQRGALAHVAENGVLTIQKYEALYPKMSRRTLQRELRELVSNGLLVSEGATNQLRYKLGKLKL